MARKPVHLTADKRRPEGRQVIWEAIRRLRRFRRDHLEDATRTNEDTIRTYLRGLHAAGYLERVDGEQPARDRRYQSAWYQLVHDCGIEAPRVTRDGRAVTQGRGREQMWRTMRIVREFSVRELAAQASIEAHRVSDEEAKHYCQYLHKAGYLVLVSGGTGRDPARYRLLPSRYTGPRAPQVQRIKQVWDANTQRVVWQSQGGGHAQ